MSALSEVDNTFQNIMRSLEHKMDFYELIEEMERFSRNSTLHENITSRIAKYLNILSLNILDRDTQKIRKQKIRTHLSSIKSNICAISCYENLRSVNYKGRNHMGILFSIINTPGKIAEILIQMFEIYNINFKSREINSISLKPSMYVRSATSNGIYPYYGSETEEWVERKYMYNAASDFLENYYSQPNYSAEFYERATRLGFGFGYSYSYSRNSGIDIIRRLLEYVVSIDKNIFDFISLVFNNYFLNFNDEWITSLCRMYSKYVWSDEPVEDNVAEYSDKLLEILGRKYAPFFSELLGRYDIEYIIPPVIRVSGTDVFSNKRIQIKELMRKVVKCPSSSQLMGCVFYKVRNLMLLEQLVKEMDENNNFTELLTPYSDTVYELGKCKYSILCELKKYAIRYKKERFVKNIDEIRLDAPGSMQYDHNRKYLANVYSGPSTILPVLECDCNDERSQLLIYSYDRYDSDY